MPIVFDQTNVEEYESRRAQVMGAFSPATPVTDHALFAGRSVEMTKVMDVVSQTGRHAVIYGERGVGKTSLARVMSQILQDRCLALYYTCSTMDSYGDIWQGLLEDAKVVSLHHRAGFTGEYERIIESATKFLGGKDPTPNNVRQTLRILSSSRPLLVLIDEFDRIQESDTQRLFADSIKILSDQAIPATLVLVGAGDTIDELIAEHASVQRSLLQIRMPRMSSEEIARIIWNGMATAGMQAERGFVREVINLSQGLPHYAHLLSQHAAWGALLEGRLLVRTNDFTWAIAKSLDDTFHSVRETYYRATNSARETLHGKVLLACALTKKDDLQTFSAPDVRQELRLITRQQYELPRFATHLHDFCAPASEPRGGVLRRSGTARRFRYKFSDPLLGPYVIMKGKAEGLIPPFSPSKFSSASSWS